MGSAGKRRELIDQDGTSVMELTLKMMGKLLKVSSEDLGEMGTSSRMIGVIWTVVWMEMMVSTPKMSQLYILQGFWVYQ